MEAKSPYLKNLLDINVPVTLTLHKRVGTYPETDYTTKEPTGRMQTLYVFLKDGKECRHYASEREEETLRLFSPGNPVTVMKQEVKRDGKPSFFMLNWTEPGDIMEHTPVQTRTNTAEKTLEKRQDTYEQEQREKSIQICLQGLMQAYIAGLGSKYTTEDCGFSLLADAVVFAEEGRKRLLQKAHELAQ